MGGFQINIEEMKKKTEIEDKLLFSINNNLQECIGNLNYIKKNFSRIESELGLGLLQLGLELDLKLNPDAGIKNGVNVGELETKLFEYPYTIYSLFQHFYSKRKNYMGMNLTGLIQGKMETGLGFRSHIVKQNINDIKDEKVKLCIAKKFTEPTLDMVVYKIKSTGFEWDKFGLSANNYYYIIAELETKKYFICV